MVYKSNILSAIKTQQRKVNCETPIRSCSYYITISKAYLVGLTPSPYYHQSSSFGLPPKHLVIRYHLVNPPKTYLPSVSRYQWSDPPKFFAS